MRLPTFFNSIYRPKLISVPVAEAPPVLKKGHISFGTFNTLAKHGVSCQKTWGKVLDQLPEAEFHLKHVIFLQESMRQQWLEMFAQNAVDKSAPSFNFKTMAKFKKRIILHGYTSGYVDHLRLYDEFDIMLDSWPYCGTITSSEALLMGVPVVTLYRPGPDGDHRHNVTASILKQVGLDDLIATSEEEFVKIAVELSQNHERLRELRETLRARCLETIANPDQSKLCSELEAELRKMWTSYLEQ